MLPAGKCARPRGYDRYRTFDDDHKRGRLLCVRRWADCRMNFGVVFDPPQTWTHCHNSCHRLPLLMLWTAPPPARECHEWGLLKPSRFGGANHANDYDSRSRYRHIGFSGPRRRCWWPGGYPPSIEASLCPGVLPEANAMSGRYRSLRLVAPLVARAPGTWSHRAADAAGLREALCQTAEE